MSDWQPIETARKDRGFSVPVDLWAQERERYLPQRIADCYFKDGRWCHTATIGDGEDITDDFDMVEVFNATHWMPRPDPPAGTEEKLARDVTARVRAVLDTQQREG